jgi:hypothetical protein
MEHTTPIYIARKEVHKYFPGLSSKTLANQNSQGKGPTPMKRGRLVFYCFDELKSLFVVGDGEK